MMMSSPTADCNSDSEVEPGVVVAEGHPYTSTVFLVSAAVFFVWWQSVGEERAESPPLWLTWGGGAGRWGMTDSVWILITLDFFYSLFILCSETKIWDDQRFLKQSRIWMCVLSSEKWTSTNQTPDPLLHVRDSIQSEECLGWNRTLKTRKVLSFADKYRLTLIQTGAASEHSFDMLINSYRSFKVV